MEALVEENRMLLERVRVLEEKYENLEIFVKTQFSKELAKEMTEVKQMIMTEVKTNMRHIAEQTRENTIMETRKEIEEIERRGATNMGPEHNYPEETIEVTKQREQMLRKCIIEELTQKNDALLIDIKRELRVNAEQNEITKHKMQMIKDDYARLIENNVCATRKNMEDNEKKCRENETKMIYENKAINNAGNKSYENTIRKAIRNEYDKKQRQENIMIFGVEESKEGDPSKREEEDTKYCNRMFKEGIRVDVNIRKVIRLGKREENKKRPMLVKMENRENSSDVLMNVRNLAGAEEFKRISITADLPQEERMEQKRRFLEMRRFDRRAPERNLGQFLDKNLVGAIPKRR